MRFDRAARGDHGAARARRPDRRALARIDGGRARCTVTTLEPAEALLLAGSAFSAFLERNARLALVILRMVAGRLRYADARHAEFASHDVVGRVAQRLVELGERSA